MAMLKDCWVVIGDASLRQPGGKKREETGKKLYAKEYTIFSTTSQSRKEGKSGSGSSGHEFFSPKGKAWDIRALFVE